MDDESPDSQYVVHTDRISRSEKRTETVKKKTHRYFLQIFQTGLDEDRLGSIDRYLLHAVQELLDDKIQSAPSETEIDIWVESGGGDANVAYKLVLDLRSRCNRLRTIVADYAKSAATLLALGTDVIYMSEAAELGPLDVQIEHPDKEGVRVSALDVADALQWLAQFAVQYTIGGGAEVVKWTKLPRIDVLRQFQTFTASLLQPLVSKLDPLLIHKASNELNIANRYAHTLLRGRRLAEGDEKRHTDFKKIVDHLVHRYPAHDFCICRHEAAAFGLPVRLAEKYSKWQCLMAMHKEFRDAIFAGMAGSGIESAINLWSESEIDGIMQQQVETQTAAVKHEQVANA